MYKLKPNYFGDLAFDFEIEYACGCVISRNERGIYTKANPCLLHQKETDALFQSLAAQVENCAKSVEPVK
jgi:hypothetical protein